jgi:hypothetical protein
MENDNQTSLWTVYLNKETDVSNTYFCISHPENAGFLFISHFYTNTNFQT